MQALKNIVINAAMILALLFGLTVSATAASSFEEVKALAEKGDSFYQGYLGDYYSKGNGVRQDYSKALEWYQKSADQGFALAQYNLARMYYEGKGTPQNYIKTIELYRQAAAQGHS